MRLVDYLSLIRRRLALFGAVIGLVALISLGLSFMREPGYEATVKLRARPPAPGSLSDSFSTVLEDNAVMTDLGTEAHLVTSYEVGAMVAERLGLDVPPSALAQRIEVVHLQRTLVLHITARAADPLLSIELADAFADAYLTVRRADVQEVLDRTTERLAARLQQVQQRLNDAERRLAAAPPESFQAAEASSQRDLAMADLVVLQTQLRHLSDRSAVEAGFGEIIVPATEAKLVRDTSPMRSLVFGVLLGGPVALAIVLLLDSLNETLRTEDDAREVTSAEVLGLIPVDSWAAYSPGGNGNGIRRLLGGNGNGNGGGIRRLLGANGNGNGNGIRRLLGSARDRSEEGSALTVDADPFSSAAEAYRTTSLNLATVAEEVDARTILVTSPLAGDGKTTTVANIAVSHAERGQSVVLLSGDLRRPDLHELMGADAEPGLADLVAGAPVKGVVQSLRPHLAFVGSGADVDRPDQVLGGANLRRLLDRLRATPKSERGASDKTVLIDSAPMLQAAEVLTLARAVDGVVLVLRAGVTRRNAAARAVDQIRRAGGRLLGVVLVGASDGAQLGLEDRRIRMPERRLTAIGPNTSDGESTAAGS